MRDTENSKQNLAVLVGNGLSVAHNRNLELRKITEIVLESMRTVDGDNVLTTVRKIAERTMPDGVNSDDDFEALIDSFGSLDRTLQLLEELAEYKGENNNELVHAMRVVRDFSVQVKDSGVSYVLEAISKESTVQNSIDGGVKVFIEEILNSTSGKIVFGNLNYDTVLLAGLMGACKDELTDLGQGYGSVAMEIGSRSELSPLRKTRNFPADKRVKLVHLHGSLTYWRSGDGKRYAKLKKDSLRKGNPWKRIRSQEITDRPVVVLANRNDKSAHVEEYPFRLAYDEFSEALNGSKVWLIVGYSFRDDPVNSLLACALRNSDSPPSIIVVTKGDDPSIKKRLSSLQIFEGSPSLIPEIHISREGAFEFAGSSLLRDVLARNV